MLLTAYLNLPLVKFRRNAQNRAAHECKRYLFAEMTPPNMHLVKACYIKERRIAALFVLHVRDMLVICENVQTKCLSDSVIMAPLNAA